MPPASAASGPATSAPSPCWPRSITLPSETWASSCASTDTTTATVDDLVGRGLVARLPHLPRRRAHAVSLTANGRRAVTRIRRLAEEANGDLLAALPAGERARLVALVAKALAGR